MIIIKTILVWLAVFWGLIILLRNLGGLGSVELLLIAAVATVAAVLSHRVFTRRKRLSN